MARDYTGVRADSQTEYGKSVSPQKPEYKGGGIVRKPLTERTSKKIRKAAARVIDPNQT